MPHADDAALFKDHGGARTRIADAVGGFGRRVKKDVFAHLVRVDQLRLSEPIDHRILGHPDTDCGGRVRLRSAVGCRRDAAGEDDRQEKDRNRQVEFHGSPKSSAVGSDSRAGQIFRAGPSTPGRRSERPQVSLLSKAGFSVQAISCASDRSTQRLRSDMRAQGRAIGFRRRSVGRHRQACHNGRKLIPSGPSVGGSTQQTGHFP